LGLYRGLVPHFYCHFDPTQVTTNERGVWTLLTIRIWCYLATGIISIFAMAAYKPTSFPAMFWAWMVPPTVASLFFELTPYFTLSAYGILTHWYTTLRLQERAIAHTLAWLNWQTSPEALSPDERYWFRLYGLGYCLFRTVFDSIVVGVLFYWAT